KVIELVDQQNPSRRLNNFHGKRMKVDSWYAGRKTPDRISRCWIDGIVGIRNPVGPKGGFIELHPLLRPWRHGRCLSHPGSEKVSRRGRGAHIPDAGQIGLLSKRSK